MDVPEQWTAMTTDNTYHDTLILKARQGDKDAFGMLVRSYMKPAYSCALALVGSHDEALDLSQQAFIRAWQSIARFEPGKRFFTWYYRILRNLCLNSLRDGKLHARPFSAYECAPDIADTGDTPDESLQRTQLRDAVRDAIARLRPEDREILHLREFEERSYAEISELLECPMGTVMSRLYYARKHLKDLLEEML